MGPKGIRRKGEGPGPSPDPHRWGFIRRAGLYWPSASRIPDQGFYGRFSGGLAVQSRKISRRRRSSLASACGRTEGLEARVLLAHDPVIELRFDEPEGSTTVTDSAAAGGVLTGTLTGDITPEIRTNDPSPAGSNYLHLDGNGQYLGSGGRVDMSALLNPVLGGTSSLGFYVRTDQVGDI